MIGAINRMKRTEGFTLIELMIVVAIIGILAAIAIPNFLRFQLRSRASEGKTNLAAIRTAEEGYNAEFGTYIGAAASPGAIAVPPLSSDKQNWVCVVGAPAPAGQCGFGIVGWAPEGETYYSYQVTVSGAVAGACPAAGNPCNQFTAEAGSDIDNDATLNWWGYVKPVPGAAAGLAGTVCVAGGVYNPVSGAQDLLETVGPCTAPMGQTIF